MRRLIAVAALAGCVGGGGSVRIVESARIEVFDLVVRSCNLTVTDEHVSEGGCSDWRYPLPAVVDEREVAATIDSTAAQQLAAGLARARHALAACGGTASIELWLRIADDGRAIGADAGEGRTDIATCVVKTLADLRFPAAQRGSEAVLSIPAKAAP